MDEETIENNLTALEEMLLDEEKLVTYLSLSKDLCIHVNSSKALLIAFLENIEGTDKESMYNIAYLLSGISKENQGRTIVCPKENMSEIEHQMKIVLFRHVYSICRNNVKVNDVAYTLVNKFEDLPLCMGLVRSEVCTKRSNEETGNSKTNSQDSLAVSIPSSSSKQIKLETKTSRSKIHIENENGVKAEKVKIEVVSPKKNISSPKKPASPKKVISPKNKFKITTKPNTKNFKGIAGFFSKQNGVGKKSTESHENIKINDKTIIKEETKNIPKPAQKMEVDEDIAQHVKIEKETTVKTESKNVKKTESKTNTKKLSQIKKTAKVDKKRKRVLHVSDSESDVEKNDPFSDDEPSEPVNLSDDEIPPTPNISTIKVTSGIINPKKRRKIVDKTYTDEDGYILTKKEEVYESCSENEEETAIKENVANLNPIKKETIIKDNKLTTKASKKKIISPPQKGRQTSLTNFFQKK